jgi:serine protease
MPGHRLSSRLGIGLVVAAASIGAWLTEAPRAGTQMTLAQARVPSIAVPRVSVPVVSAPAAPAAPIAPQPAPRPAPRVQRSGWRPLTAARAEAFVQAARLGLDYLPNEVLVKFKPGMGPADYGRALTIVSTQQTGDALDWRGGVAVVRDDIEMNAHVLAERLRAQPEVEYAEPNFIATIDPIVREAARASSPTVPARAVPARRNRGANRATGVPSDTDYNAFQWNFNLINMPGAWDIQPGGRPEIIVAVIDTGVTVVATNLVFPLWTGGSIQDVSLPYAVNPDLPGSRLVLPRDYAFLDPDGPVVDMDGHGTHVSSTIGEATNNAFLAAGIAYNVRIMPVKVCAQYWDIMIARARLGVTGFIPGNSGGCGSADIADGVRYAVDNGAKVVNISLGGSSPSLTIQSALSYAAASGAFVAVSMGNDFESGNPVNYPAAYAAGIDGVMSVASVGWDRARAYYSSTGTHCEITAPGGDSRSGAARLDGGLIWQSTLLTGDVSASLLIPRFDRYNRVGFQGTSMASPHVAGLAALLMSQMPGLTPAQVEKIIRMTALDLGTAGRDDVFGFGLIQPRAALFGRGISR